MSNQSNDGFQGSQPFITDKQFQNLSLDEIRHIIEEEKEGLKKDYKEFGERRKLIKQYNKIKKAREKIQQGIDIKPKPKKKPPTKKVGPPDIGVRAGGARGTAAPPKFGQLRFFGQREKIWAKPVF